MAIKIDGKIVAGGAGKDGKSAYQAAIEGGYPTNIYNEQDFNTALANINNYVTEDEIKNEVNEAIKNIDFDNIQQIDVYSAEEEGDIDFDNYGGKPGDMIVITSDDNSIPYVTKDEFEELKTSVSEGKSLIADAVTDKGVPTASDASFQVMANNINNIQKIKTQCTTTSIQAGNSGMYYTYPSCSIESFDGTTLKLLVAPAANGNRDYVAWVTLTLS